MSKEQLIKKAKSLGIDVEGLKLDTNKKLEAAIKGVVATKIGELQAGVDKAKQAYLDLPEDSDPAIVFAAEKAVETAEKELEDFTGVKIQQSSPAAKTVTTEKPKQKVAKATADGVFEFSGSNYAFKNSTPGRFNFLGKNQSQEEWLQDPVAMELLITGNSSFVKLLKK
jgi:hypothetical protein